MSTNQEKIVEIARTYLGKREIPGNMGFTDKEFEAKMKAVGFAKGYAWCALFAELVWSQAFTGDADAQAKIKELCSASATTTFKNFDIDGTFHTSQEPIVGAIAIWRHGNGWQGHAGIVTGIPGNGTFNTIEGNTDSAGGREGIEVSAKVRKIKAPYSAKGLNLVGFIHPLPF